MSDNNGVECPHCGTAVEEVKGMVTKLNGDDAAPSPDDAILAMCVACACPFTYDENNKPRRLTPEEIVEVNEMLDETPEVDHALRQLRDSRTHSPGVIVEEAILGEENLLENLKRLRRIT